MQDDLLKRVIHFVCGAVVGVFAGTYVGRHFGDDGSGMVVGAAVGAVVLGLLAMWQLDRFWAWLMEWFD